MTRYGDDAGMVRSVARFAAVICGGGVAGIEGLLRLRRLVGDQVDLTLLSPAEYLSYRPLAVLEPFAAGAAPRYSIPRIATDAAARLVRDTLAWVDRAGRVVHTGGGQRLPYDALLLAVGGRQGTELEHADVFTGSDDQSFRRIVEDIETGSITSLAFVLPSGPCWPLPLYELALLTAGRAKQVGASLEIVITIPGPRPLHAFGGDAGDAISRLLRHAGITVHTSAAAQVVAPHHVVLRPRGVHLHPERIVTLPTISGPNVRGIPGDARNRFLPIDGHCRVPGTDGRVFAAGDATDLPVKQGGVGAQQADTAAAGIAHLAGLAEPPQPLRPVIRGTLLTGGTPLYLSAHLLAGEGWQARMYEQPPWPLDDKVIAEELGPYVRGSPAAPPQHPPVT
jgi:sulfide:quinone oxidoreductase